MTKAKTTPRAKPKAVVTPPTTLWDDIDRLVELTHKPLPDMRLESLQARVHGPVGLPYIRFLYLLAEFLKPTLAVELGTEWGVTSAHLCGAVAKNGGHVIGIDDTATHRIIEHTIPAWYPDAYTFIHKHSLAAATDVEILTKQYGPIGLLFQDTRPDDQWAEWEAYTRLMKPGAVWVGNHQKTDKVLTRISVESKILTGLRGSGSIWVAIL